MGLLLLIFYFAIRLTPAAFPFTQKIQRKQHNHYGYKLTITLKLIKIQKGTVHIFCNTWFNKIKNTVLTIKKLKPNMPLHIR